MMIPVKYPKIGPEEPSRDTTCATFLAGIIIAFVALGLYFGFGVKPNAPPPLVPPGSQETPATGQ
jgi:hypothetical protein